MPKLIPLCGLFVKRGPIKITPEVGEPFDFTQEEAEKFLAAPTPMVERVKIDAPDDIDAAPAASKRGRKKADDTDGL